MALLNVKGQASLLSKDEFDSLDERVKSLLSRYDVDTFDQLHQLVLSGLDKTDMVRIRKDLNQDFASSALASSAPSATSDRAMLSSAGLPELPKIRPR